ncbi:PAS domain-containing protein [Kordiimonas aquimaris]|uniref:PAS domain-containing protein n=1 Tax=Kordiimonas aquimaris TaxID=707591 RepID=UPI0021CDF40A|nr:PAS domain-containing protein [Kordiimonas aquimaris]
MGLGEHSNLNYAKLVLRKPRLVLGYKLTKITDVNISKAHPVIQFGKYWREISSDGLLVDRKAFNPMRIPQLLPWIVIIEAIDSAYGGYRYRLVGSGVTSMAGFNLTGQDFGSWLDMHTKRVQELALLYAFEEKGPSYLKGSLSDNYGDSIPVIIGLFPSFSQDKHNRQMICLVAPEDEDCINQLSYHFGTMWE